MTIEAVHPESSNGEWRQRFYPGADFVYGLASVMFVLFAWEAAVRLLDIPAFFLPRPTEVAAALVRGAPLFVPHLWVTLLSTVISFLIATALGIVLGTLVAEMPTFRRLLLPLLIALQSMPRIALAPIIIVWFGFGISSKIVLGAFTAFFPVFLNVMHGMSTIDNDQLALMRTLKASRLQTFVRIKIPTALPFILAGTNIALIFAMLSVIVAEFVGSSSGMGYLILNQSNQMDTTGVFASVFILSVVGLMFHYGLQFLRNRLLFWSAGSEIAGA
ncbi:ABC transporter permease [Rhizobium puerariae]|uniref:ABC transporter permease n=1 Tax=Rhizobium puerariae TaxID=1585791 RepID=A0ABV6AMT4_9HYPH